MKWKNHNGNMVVMSLSSNKSRLKKKDAIYLMSHRCSVSQSRNKPNFFVTRLPSFSDQHYSVLSNAN